MTPKLSAARFARRVKCFSFQAFPLLSNKKDQNKNCSWENNFRASIRPYAPPKTSQIKPLSCYRQPQKSRKINTSPLCRPTSCCRRTFPSSELVVHTSSTFCQIFKCLPHLQPIFFLKKVIFPKVSIKETNNARFWCFL